MQLRTQNSKLLIRGQIRTKKWKRSTVVTVVVRISTIINSRGPYVVHVCCVMHIVPIIMDYGVVFIIDLKVGNSEYIYSWIRGIFSTSLIF